MTRSTLILLLAAGCGGFVPVQLGQPNAEDQAVVVLPVLASAGADREILRGLETCLDGRATHHPRGLAFEVEWEQIEGEQVYLSNAMDLRPSFAAPLEEQELVFELTASDRTFTTRDRVRLHVKNRPGRLPPRVRAGPDRFLDAGQRNEPVSNDLFEGIANDVITSWERIVPERVESEFTAARAGADSPVVFRLTGVRDGLQSAPDYLILRPFAPGRVGERAPTASIVAETSIAPGDTVRLDATGSTDPNGDPIAYRWEQTGGLPVDALPSAGKVTFDAPRRQQELSIRVFARDQELESAPAKVSVVVGAGVGGDLPVVVSSNRRARPGRVVVLDALGDTGLNTSTEFEFVWNQTVGTPVAFETEELGRFVHFEAPVAPADLGFSVFVASDVIDGPPAVARVTVVNLDDNLPPVIYLTPSTSDPEPGQEVTVVATIADPEHDAIESCQWSTEVEPDGPITLDPGELCGPDASGEAVVHFHAPAAGATVTVTLTVRDEFQATGVARVDITSTY